MDVDADGGMAEEPGKLTGGGNVFVGDVVEAVNVVVGDGEGLAAAGGRGRGGCWFGCGGGGGFG